MSGPPNPKRYNPRHPERTLLYQTVPEHCEAWLELASAGQFDGQGDHHTPAPYIEKAFRKYLECGIFAHGFARVRCDDCGDDYLVAFSCKGRGVCPSCNTRRMAEAAAHLTDHVFPRLPVRQWVLSVPKRIRYYLQRDKGALNAALRIFLRVVQQSLQTHCPGAAQCDPASLHLGAVAFIHRFGSSLNTHVHFHVCVVDGVFEALADADAITFHPAQIDDAAIAEVQAKVRKRLLRAFVARGHLESHDAKNMAAYAHGCGFSVDAGVRIEATDRAGLERLLRYCARPPFAMDRLKQRGADLVYRCGKGHAEPLPSSKYAGELVLTPLELINRIAQLVPPPRTHRHRYYGVLAPNSPLRAAVTALAQTGPVVATPDVGSAVAQVVNAGADALTPGTAPVPGGAGGATVPEPPEKPKPRPPAHYLWAALIARIYEVFPLNCPNCGGQMRIIAFITFSADIHKILEHIGMEPESPRPRALPRHAGHRCGMSVVRRRHRRWARVWRLCRTGMRQTNHRPTTPTISALPGEPDKGGGTAAWAGLCPIGVPASLCFDRRANSSQTRQVTAGVSAFCGPIFGGYSGSCG